MKNSWRIGIDESNKTSLIKKGIYKYIRNPAYAGINLMNFGICLFFSNLPMFFLVLGIVYTLHVLIKNEENHLTKLLGNEYIHYKKLSKRYF